MNDKQFVTYFEKKVKRTLVDYKLVNEKEKKKEKIMVACSGGKDSTSTLYLLHKFGYNVEGMMIDLLIGKWSEDNLANMKKFCRGLGVKLNVVDIRQELGCSMCYLRERVQKTQKVSNCLVCGVIKRWLMNKKARELGGAKVATGHNLDDGAETVMMNLLKGNLGLMVNMAPQTGFKKDKKFVPRIKPLYFMLNAEVRRYSQIKKFPVLYEPCPCRRDSLRKRIRDELNEKEKKNPKVKENLVKVFLKLLPKIQEKYNNKEEISHCEDCGEPSRGMVCKMCQLLKHEK